MQFGYFLFIESVMIPNSPQFNCFGGKYRMVYDILLLVSLSNSLIHFHLFC